MGIILLLIFISFNLNAQTEIEKVTRNMDGKLLLHASSCEEIETQLSALQEWTKNSDGRDCKLSTKNVSKKNYKCVVDISNCIPKNVSTYHGKISQSRGPNCLNLPLVMSKIIPSLRHTGSKEFSYYMKPPLCEKLTGNDDPRPGDIGRIKMIDGADVHAFIYISNKLAYSKDGMEGLAKLNESGTSSYYKLQPLKEVFANYYDEDNMTKTYNESSPRTLDYYRCISMEKYLKETKLDKNVKELSESLNQFECDISFSTFKETYPMKNKTIRNLIDTSEVINELIEDDIIDIKKGRIGEKDIYTLGGIKLGLKSIHSQVELLRNSNYHNLYNTRAENISKELKEAHETLNDYLDK